MTEDDVRYLQRHCTYDGTLEQLRREQYSRLAGKVYLDCAGTTLYPESLPRQFGQRLSSHLFGNPHSVQSSAAAETSEAVQLARFRVLRHLSAPTSEGGGGGGGEEYAVVFASNVTAALKLVAETYPFGPHAPFGYLRTSHTSVLGMRELARQRGASIACLSSHDVISMRPGSQEAERGSEEEKEEEGSMGGLFAYPLQCNFSGTRYSEQWPRWIRERHLTISGHKRRFRHVLVDAASFMTSGRPNLSVSRPDMIVVSFYKMFGFPTGVAALVIRKDLIQQLRRGKQYFGGGAVMGATASAPHFHRFRPEPDTSFLEDGTLPFLEIVGLLIAFDEYDRLYGGWDRISSHVSHLAGWMRGKLETWRYPASVGGGKVCEMYGEHRDRRSSSNSFSDLDQTKHDNSGSMETEQDLWPTLSSSSIIAFNLLQPNGTWMSYELVTRIANLCGIHLRAGHMCNPGACEQYLGLQPEDAIADVQSGKVCWDDFGTKGAGLSSKGCVRISFGAFSSPEDCFAVMRFLEAFVASQMTTSKSTNVIAPSLAVHESDISTMKSEATLEKIIIYPIKSCAGFRSEQHVWPLNGQGLAYDRVWCLRDAITETTMTQKKYPKMATICPLIDLVSGTMSLMHEGMDPLIVDLNGMGLARGSRPREADDSALIYKDNAKKRADSEEADAWFSKIFQRPVRLVRVAEPLANSESASSLPSPSPSPSPYLQLSQSMSSGERGRFVNESPFVAVNQHSVDALRAFIDAKFSKDTSGSSVVVMASSHVGERADSDSPRAGPHDIVAEDFRPNFVISGPAAWDEDQWSRIVIGDSFAFEVTGSCQRCQMVCVDQSTGKVNSAPYLALSSTRRKEGTIHFGVQLSCCQENRSTSSSRTWLIREQSKITILKKASPSE